MSPRILVLVALLYGSAAAWYESSQPDGLRDVDGWGEKIFLTAPNRIPAAEIWQNPSIWKGPVIPTLFTASYVIYPSRYAPLVVNVLGFAATAGLLSYTFLRAGGDRRAVTLAILAWIVYPPHRILFGHYYAEQVIGLFSAVLFAQVVLRPHRAFLIGVAAGILLLARSPFLPVIVAIPLLTLWYRPPHRLKWVAGYALGFLLAFLPWGLRNSIVLGEFVPFTVEGGQTLFHGSYLGLDDDRWQVLKNDPRVAAILAAAPTDPVAKMHYLSDEAKKQMRADPLGQAERCLRKAIKFHVHLEPYSWWPSWRAGPPAAIYLVLAGWTLWKRRRLRLVQWCGLWALGPWLVHAAVFGMVRYNFPVLPMWLFLAASAFWPPTEPRDESAPPPAPPPDGPSPADDRR